jgi:hypothetical protein
MAQDVQLVALVGLGIGLVLLGAAAMLAVTVLGGDRLPLAWRRTVRVPDVLGTVVAPVLLAIAGLPPLGWTRPLPREPGVQPRWVDAVVGLAGIVVPGIALLAGRASDLVGPAALALLLAAALPVPGTAGGRVVAAVLPGARRAQWRGWERRVPRAVAPALVVVLALATGVGAPS